MLTVLKRQKPNKMREVFFKTQLGIKPYIDYSTQKHFIHMETSPLTANDNPYEKDKGYFWFIIIFYTLTTLDNLNTFDVEAYGQKYKIYYTTILWFHAEVLNYIP